MECVVLKTHVSSKVTLVFATSSKNVRFSMAGMCSSGQRSQITHVRNVLWSKTSESALLECVVVKNVRFSLAGCVVVKKSDSACPECVAVKTVRFNMAGMCRGKKRQIQATGP
jgi:hypothetical protein